MATKAIESILEYSLEIILILVFGYLTTLRKRVVLWLETRTSAQQRDILHRLAGEAAALAESIYFGGNGPAKLRAAMSYVNERLEDRGINFSAESIRAAIEKSVMEYNISIKPGGSVIKAIDPTVNNMYKGFPHEDN